MFGEIYGNIKSSHSGNPNKFVGVESSTGVEWFGQFIGDRYIFRRLGDAEVFYANSLSEASKKLYNY